MLRFSGLAFAVLILSAPMAGALAVDTEPAARPGALVPAPRHVPLPLFRERSPNASLDARVVACCEGGLTIELTVDGYTLRLPIADGTPASPDLALKRAALLGDLAVTPQPMPAAETSTLMARVPAPPALPLMLSGLAGLGFMALRSRRGRVEPGMVTAR